MILNHTFYYPGKVEWNAVEATLVDPGGNFDTSKALVENIRRAGYVYPDEGQHFRIEYQRREAIHFNAKQQQELQNSTFEGPHMRNRIPPVMANFRPPTPEPAFYNPRSPRTQAPSPNNFEDRMATSATLCDNA